MPSPDSVIHSYAHYRHGKHRKVCRQFLNRSREAQLAEATVFSILQGKGVKPELADQHGGGSDNNTPMSTKKSPRPKGKGILLPCIPHPHDLPLHVWRVMLAAEIARIYHPKSLAAIERGWKEMQKAAKWPLAVIDEVMDGSSYLLWVAQHGWDLDIRLAKAAKKKRRLTSDKRGRAGSDRTD